MLELIFLIHCSYITFYIFPCIVYAKVWATYLSLPFNFISCVSLRNSLWGSDVLLFLEFINIVSTLLLLCYNFSKFIVLLYTFLVIFFLKAKNIWFALFHLANFQMCYLLLLAQVLLIIFKAFVSELIFWILLHILFYIQLQIQL